MKRVVILAVVFLSLLLGDAHARQRQPDQIWLAGIPTNVTPGTPFTLRFETNSSDKPVHVRVYRLSTDEAVSLRRGGAGDITRGREPVWRGTVPSRRWWYTEAAIGPFPIGLYDIELSMGDAKATAVGNVTTLGLLSANGQSGVAGVWAIDLRTFRRHLGPTQLSILEHDASRTVRCDETGLAILNGVTANGALFVARTQDGSVEIESYYGSGYVKHGVQYVQTDRPVYRPGQLVHFRAILRNGYADSYALPTRSHRVQIESPDGGKIYDREATISQFGTLNGDAQLTDGAQLGQYAVSIDGTYVSGFAVEAYKKPEYLIDAHAVNGHLVAGEDALLDVQTQYFFGRPAAGMHIHYSAYSGWFGPLFYDPYWIYRPARPDAQLPQAAGDATTDDSGFVRLRIPTKRLADGYTMTVRIEARDASGRTMETSEAFTAYPAAVIPSLVPRSWYANAGDDVAYDVHANDLRGASVPNKKIHIEVRRNLWDQVKHRYDDDVLVSQTLRTDSKGATVFHWRAGASGSYRIAASLEDERGNAATASQYLWVIGADNWWMPPTEQPVVIPLRSQLSGDERAHVLIRMPSTGRDALVAVLADRIVSLRVIHVTGYAISLGVDPPKNATRFSVQVMLPSENGVSQASALFERKAPKLLHMTLQPDRARYAPGERATFAVRVTDAGGNPQRAEISVGVVDDAIYAVQGEQNGNPIDAFYGNVSWMNAQAGWYRPNYNAAYSAPVVGTEAGVPSGQGVPLKTIAKVTSRAAGTLVKPGTTADVFSVNGAPVPLRTNFQDTAYWTPAVVTGSDGRARVSFTWPDNLTTWRTTELGISEDTSLGRAQAESLVTKDFLVRLEMPRFLRKGDTTTIGGIAHGQKDARNVRLRFVPQAVDPLDASLQLDNDGMASTTWTLDSGQNLGTRTLALYGTDGRRTDGLQLPLPIEATGAAEHVRDAGKLPEHASLALALPQGYDPGALTITITPSITAQLVQNLRVLDVYPYYCTEQTMSAALPAVFIDRLFKRTGYVLPGDVQPPAVIAHAVTRLAQLQHSDGSWGWWENDPAHPFMTAYALYGLTEFKKDGHAVPAQMFERGVDSLVEQLRTQNSDTLRLWGGVQPGSEWNTRAFMLFVLSDAAPNRLDRSLLAQTLEHAPSLNSYALSVLGLAYHQLGDDAVAKSILARLNARALQNGPYTYWAGATWHYAWEDDPIETTAYALRLNAALAPQSPLVDRVVAFLRSEQHGSWWYTTKDTAAAVYAIAESETPDSSELRPDETVRVLVDGRTVRSTRVTRPVLEAAEAEVRVPASALHDGSVVTFERDGRGALYWSTDFVRYAPPQAHAAADSSRSIFARLFPKQPPLRIERRYTAPHPGPWRVGDEIRVDVTVTASEDVQYVAIEDPFPAGVEYAPPQGEAANASWSGMQFFDDRAVFFATQMYKRWPLHLSYDLRVTTPGSYTASAPTSYAMYGPPITAVGDEEHVVVRNL